MRPTGMRVTSESLKSGIRDRGTIVVKSLEFDLARHIGVVPLDTGYCAAEFYGVDALVIEQS